jgi:hypothetical protein
VRAKASKEMGAPIRKTAWSESLNVVDGRRKRIELRGAGGDVAAVNGPQCGRRKVLRQVGGEAVVEDRPEDGDAERAADRAEERRGGCRRSELTLGHCVLHGDDEDLHHATDAQAEDDHVNRRDGKGVDGVRSENRKKP